MMKSLPSLVLTAFCVLLLFFSISTKEVTALGYLAAMLDNGNYNLNHGRYYEAISFYNRALKSYPDNFDALLGKGFALISLHQYKEAIPYFDECLKIYPHNAFAIYGKEIALEAISEH